MSQYILFQFPSFFFFFLHVSLLATYISHMLSGWNRAFLNSLNECFAKNSGGGKSAQFYFLSCNKKLLISDSFVQCTKATETLAKI